MKARNRREIKKAISVPFEYNLAPMSAFFSVVSLLCEKQCSPQLKSQFQVVIANSAPQSPISRLFVCVSFKGPCPEGMLCNKCCAMYRLLPRSTVQICNAT